MQAVEAALATGSDAELLAALEDAEYELVAAGQPSAQIYGAQLVAHYTVNDAASARFLWKRIPQQCKADAELTHLWSVGKLVWTRQYVEMFALLKSIGPSLSPLNQNTVARFTKAHALRTTELLCKAYTSISPEAACGLTGMAAGDLRDWLTATGWTEQDGMFVAPAATATDTGLTQPSGNGGAAGMEQLQQLTEYIVELDT